MKAVLVSHTHWDREWYRTFQSFRARLVDTVDRVLDLVAADEGFHFQLDGQAIVLEDYLEIRPERREALEAACRAGRIGIGPWYVQPDSLLPSGEAHVRNLLEGRRVARSFGPCSTVAYTPDSFGHPAQFPQLFAGFGLSPFVYWRGNGDEIAELPAEYRWAAPDGSELVACHMARGYFAAWGVGRDPEAGAERLEETARFLADRAPRPCILLMNGVDHMLPDPDTRAAAEALAKRTGWQVERGLLDAYVAGLRAEELPRFEGELVGGRIANLLPGVWSTRTYLKLANRRCESGLEGWAEPWAALGHALGAPDERPALREAWRALLANQAHDSICGCSQDAVHRHMGYRYDAARELADETSARMLERVAGLGAERQVPRLDAEGRRRRRIPIAVFNPSPHPRTDVVRLPLDGFPTNTAVGIDPLLSKNHGAEGFTVDGRPVRLVAHEANVRPRLVPDAPVYDLEFVAEAVPAFGWQELILERAEASPDQRDEGREIAADGVRVRARDDGSLDVELGEMRFEGLGALEDTGDRGDSYDFDPVTAGPPSEVTAVAIERERHASGIQRLRVHRTLRLATGLAPDRASRAEARVEMPVVLTARVAPGVARVDLEVELDNRADDHRLRMRFPTGRPAPAFLAATTFDAARRRPGALEDRDWIHPAPTTFPSQGWVAAGGLCVAAPGLCEAEVDAAGTIALTLLRAVGWLSLPDLTTRPGDAGPNLPTPEAQCRGPLALAVSLFAAGEDVASRARDAELSLRSTAAGDAPLHAAGAPLLELEPRGLVLSALKPAEDGQGLVLRVLNPGDTPRRARIHTHLPLASVEAVRLDEAPLPDASPPAFDGSRIEAEIPAHALRSFRLRSTGS